MALVFILVFIVGPRIDKSNKLTTSARKREFESRRQLVLEKLALRHQLAVLNSTSEDT